MILFVWIGLVTIGYFYLRHKKPNEAFASFAIPAFFAAIGIWLCCVGALLLNLATGTDFIRQRPPGSPFLVIFAGIWLAFISYYLLKGWQRVSAYFIIALAVGIWISIHWDYYWVNEAGWDGENVVAARAEGSAQEAPIANPADQDPIPAIAAAPVSALEPVADPWRQESGGSMGGAWSWFR